jgi:DNA-binding response OmpR family regulator
MISANFNAHDPSASQSPTRESAVRSLLLVDDEATLRSALRRYFVRRGWQVEEAEDGEHARSLLLDGQCNGTRFDAVLTDMRMPRLSGIELHELVSHANAPLARRFIFSSGDTGDDAAVEFLARSGCPVIAKPFELSSLLALVERVAATQAPGPSPS